MSWRDRARPIVAEVLATTHGMTPKEVRAALREAYPFGMRRYHPYKIWLDEIDRQMNPREHLRRSAGAVVNENQGSLFGEI